MEAAALQLIHDTAITAAGANRIDSHTPAIVLGDNIKTLEHLNAGRSRYRGKFSTNSIAAFAAYVSNYGLITPVPLPEIKPLKGETSERITFEVQLDGPTQFAPGIFVDPAAWRATAVMNLGDPENPGHCDHTAHVQIERTAAYAGMLNACKNFLDQRALIEWLADWRNFIVPDFGVEGENAGKTSVATAIAAIRNVKVTATAESTSAVTNTSNTRSALEAIEARGATQLPDGFRFTTKPAKELGMRTFTLDLSVIPDDPGKPPRFRLRLVEAEQVAEDIAEEFAQLIANALPNTLPLIGTFTPQPSAAP